MKIMNNATLGLELEYSDFKVFLNVDDNEIDENDFKSKHITIINGDQEAKKLFSYLGEYGIRVTLDTRSQHDELKGEIPLTIELVLDHNKFEIDHSRCIKDKEIFLSKSFAEQVDMFSKYIMSESRDETVLQIKFDGNDNEFCLKIPSYNGRRELMPHITIPCPLCRIGDPEGKAPYEWEGVNGNKIPEYSLNYLLKILNSLKAVTKSERELTPDECKCIEKHDPKQYNAVIPKTSFNTIFSIIRGIKSDYRIADEEQSDYYITSRITYKELIENINSNGVDLLKDNLIGIGSIGSRLEKIWNEECPIFEFRGVGCFDSSKIYLFEQTLKEDLLHLYIGNRTPFTFTGVQR